MKNTLVDPLCIWPSLWIGRGVIIQPNSAGDVVPRTLCRWCNANANRIPLKTLGLTTRKSRELCEFVKFS